LIYHNIDNDINNYIFDIIIVIGHNIKFSYLISKIIGTKPMEENIIMQYYGIYGNYGMHEF